MTSFIVLQILLTSLLRGVLATVSHHAVFSLPPRVTASFSGAEAAGSRDDTEISVENANGIITPRKNHREPFVACPESFNLPFKTCDQCGGDSKVPGMCNEMLFPAQQSSLCRALHGHCLGYYCNCTHDVEDHSGQITSTAVVAGQTAKMVFEAKILTEYTILRASTTVTVTETTTWVGGTMKQTATFVVFAGGATWWTICESIPFGPM